MDILGGFNELIKTLSANRGSRVWFVIILVVILGVGWAGKKYIFKEPTKVINECDYLMEQNKQLVNALFYIKNNLDSVSKGKAISYRGQAAPFIFASFSDTTKPEQKKMTAGQYQQQIGKVSKQIDSILFRNQKVIDSVKKKQEIKTKSI